MAVGHERRFVATNPKIHFVDFGIGGRLLDGENMEINQDFRDLLAAFNANAVEYLVVGAHALAAHGHIRATKRIDVWVHAHPENAPRVLKALEEFGAPITSLSVADFKEPGLVFHIGVPPVRIDVLTSIDGITFPQAWPNPVATTFGDQPCNVLSKDDLILNKKASGRLQDLADVERLESGDVD